jgi:hypothetical protein
LQQLKEGRDIRRFLVILVIAWTAAGAATTAPAHGASSSNWYWTPGACKSELQTRGVQFYDGRTYNVQRAFCVGLHNHCWVSAGLRRYKVFIAVMRSYDGIVRRFQLTVTGRKSWTGTPARIIEHYMTADQFYYAYGSAAWSVATTENQGGCYDIHP